MNHTSDKDWRLQHSQQGKTKQFNCKMGMNGHFTSEAKRQMGA